MSDKVVWKVSEEELSYIVKGKGKRNTMRKERAFEVRMALSCDGILWLT